MSTENGAQQLQAGQSAVGEKREARIHSGPAAEYKKDTRGTVTMAMIRISCHDYPGIVHATQRGRAVACL
ncbi:hypothetical protein EYC80_009810 [Monilinia laxa]|uniref:Uncharacterized protein n=1 Tax=Monilinia laxa TaxID=61186 RepID=A0A5N6JQT0_MONLA|nr:hypothetical protein EYC80_009810 [Monilinia laxa]